MQQSSHGFYEAIFPSRPFEGAEDALDSILLCLKSYIPFKLWMITRLKDNEWTVIRSLDEGYGTTPGATFDWRGTYCSRMVKGEGPMFAEDASTIEAYRQAKINHEIPLRIGAYIGMPIVSHDGHVQGTICALDPEAQQPLSDEQKLLVTTLTRSLGTLHTVYAQAENARRRAERFRYEAQTDHLTGVLNRRGWDLAVSDQEMATSRTAQNAMVAIIDLDNLKRMNDVAGHAAGDALLIAAGNTLRQQMPEQSIVARIGGDEFALLVPDISAQAAIKLIEGVDEALTRAGVPCSVGFAMRLQHPSMHATVKAADKAMYQVKARNTGCR